MAEIVTLYSDGGCCGPNPSPIGGNWAYRALDATGACVQQASGTVTPAECSLPKVSSNVAELLAAVKALEVVPDGWAGVLFTDSVVTRCRVAQTKRQAKLNGVPVWLAEMLAAQKERLGKYKVLLVGGHPTALELHRGRNKKGLVVSWENVHCDRACKRAARRLLRKAVI